MRTIDLGKSQSVADIQQLYSKLYEKAEPLQLRLPASIENCRICSRGELIQFILTWAARYPEAPIATYLDETQIEVGLRNLFDDDFGFASALCAQTHGLLPAKVFLDRNNRTIPNSVVYDVFKQSLKLFSDYRLKNLRAYILINDWMEKKFPGNAFTNIYRRKVSEAATPARLKFRALVHSLYDKMSPKGADLFLQNRDFEIRLGSLSSLFYEIIENADRWGRRDLDSKSIRGAVVHFHGKESTGHETLAQQQAGTPALSHYLERNSSSDIARFAEISVFDNGPGLASRISGERSGTLNWQYNEAMRCFMRWSGSSTKENEGQGLYKAICILNQMGGFLQYRSQELNLYRDFGRDPLDKLKLDRLDNVNRERLSVEQFEEIFFLKDFRGGTRRILRNHAVTGTLFTFILPIP